MRNSAASLIIAAAIIVAASLNVFVTSAHQAPTALFCVLIILSALRLSSGAVFVIGVAATAFYFPSSRALDIPLDAWQWNVAALVVATALGVLFARQRDSSGERQRETIKRARQAERERDALRARQSRLRAVLRYAPVVVFHQDRALRYRWVEGNFPANGANEIVGKTDQHLFRHDEAERLTDLKREAMEQQCVVREDVLLASGDGQRFYDLTVAPLYDSTGEVIGITGASVDVTDRKQVEDEILEATTRQRAVAGLALQALTDGDLGALFDEATAVLAHRLDVDYGLLLEVDPTGKSLTLRSGAGWPRELLGATIDNGNGTSQMGYMLHSIMPVVANDLANDTRFEPAPILRERGVVSGASATITAGGRQVGILGAYARIPRRFNEDDVEFLSGLASVLSAAVDRARAETRANEQGRALWALFERSPDLICSLDAQGRFQAANPSAEQLFGRSAAQLQGTPFSSLVLTEHAETIQEALRQAARGRGQTVTLDCAVAGGDGGRVELHGSATPIVINGALSAVYLILRNMTERLASEGQAFRTVVRDPLTQLPNRTLLIDRLTHALSRTARHQSVTAVLIVRIDRLPEVNAEFGRDAGDLLLVALADRLQRCLRPGDTVARLGGDEFAIVLEDVDGVDGAVTVAERMIAALRAPFPVAEADAELGLTATIGIALGVSASNSAEELLKKAAGARSRAAAQAESRLGSSTYEIFDSNLNDNSIADRLRIESELSGALDRAEFHLLYQPITDLNDDRLVALESLIQWDRPTRSFGPPVEFLSIAESTGLSVPLGRWTLHEACRQARRWRSELTDQAIRVTVNLSSRQFHQPTLFDDIAAALAESGLNPGCLVLEIPERVLMADVEFSVDRVKALKAIGLGIAIDDFGSGPLSLPHLQRLSADYLKLDPRLTAGLTDDVGEIAIVAGIASLAHALGARLVAQQVTTASQLARLREAGCDLAQGPLVGESHPLRA